MNTLIGQQLPDMPLLATTGEWINPRSVAGWAVYFFYPYTGKPGVPDPLDWDNIPGAHGSTPQCISYSMHYRSFQNKNVKVFGGSLQDSEWQKECVSRLGLAMPLLSDHDQAFTTALDLPRFTIEGENYLERITLLAKDGVITYCRYPVSEPKDDAAFTFQLLTNMQSKLSA